MARLLFILAEWPRRYAPLMPNQVVDLLHRAWREVTSCLAHEPNSNDREILTAIPPHPVQPCRRAFGRQATKVYSGQGSQHCYEII